MFPKPFSLLIALVLGAAASACAPAPRARSLVPPIFRSSAARPARLPAATRASSPAPGPARLVERALQARGLRFGTDGTPRALFAYARDHGRAVPPPETRPGDLVFFDVEGRGEETCGTHAGLVDEVDPAGRILFRESRGGLVRTSVVHPGAPRSRRDTSGRVLNSFLRPKRPDDPPWARYFAGEMLCAVIRI